MKSDKERTSLAEQYFQMAGTILVVLNDQGGVVRINKKGCAVLGYKEDEIVGENWFDICVPKNIKGTVKEVFAKLMCGEIEPVEYYENSILTKSGEERVIAWHNSLLRDNAGNISGVLSSGEDISDHKKAEQALIDEKNFSKALVNSLPGVFYLFDSQGKLLQWNDNFMVVSGYSIEDLKDMSPADFFEGEDRERVVVAVQKVFDEGKAEVEAFFTTKQGKKIAYYFTGLIAEIKGQAYLVGMGIEITDRKSAEEKMKNTLDDLQLFKSMSVGRETRMIELKREVNNLSKNLGRPEPYDITFAEE
ncbi:MAG: PAS domain-containing protein [Candidatus Omnitrophota bacterium]